MAHTPLHEAYLLPRKVYVFCANHNPSHPGETRLGSKCGMAANYYLVADGKCVLRVCRICANRDLPELQRIYGGWSKAPIFHDDPAFDGRAKPRFEERTCPVCKAAFEKDGYTIGCPGCLEDEHKEEAE